MSNIDKRGLREAAEKATKGRWAVEFDDEIYSTDGVNHEQIAMVFSENEARDAAFIAAANPATVLALLASLEAAEKRIAEQQSAIIAPGIMRCAGCGFVLTKNSINMAAGTITAGDSKTEPCPNGCGPLWPVTWKEQALQMRDDSEQWFIELQQAKNRIAELEEREILLPERSSMLHRTDFHDDYQTVMAYKVSEVIAAIRAAGIRIKGE
ncbi:TPA: ead/Ea22-like family protein [Escherichia coli]